jgi:hypothetical protein
MFAPFLDIKKWEKFLKYVYTNLSKFLQLKNVGKSTSNLATEDTESTERGKR